MRKSNFGPDEVPSARHVWPDPVMVRIQKSENHYDPKKCLKKGINTIEEPRALCSEFKIKYGRVRLQNNRERRGPSTCGCFWRFLYRARNSGTRTRPTHGGTHVQDRLHGDPVDRFGLNK